MAGSFAISVADWIEKAQGNAELVVRRVALDIFRRIVMKSPVDTGRFKGNWQVQIGAVPAGTLEIDDKAGTVTMARVQAEVLRLEVGQTIYLVNNLSYARRLEYGWSKQAPAGMVRLTIAEFPQVVQTAGEGLP